MEDKRKIAGVVILFNPDDSVPGNILSYLDIVDRLFVYDNSKSENQQLLEGLGDIDVEYFHNGTNDGVSHALNFCARVALDQGYELMLTMDQDSYFPPDMASMYSDYLKKVNFKETGLVSPWHNMKSYKDPPRTGTSFVPHVPTSGNVLDLNVLRELDFFEEKYFIDYVDIEYCFRLKSRGYRVLQVNTIELIHNLGNLVEKRIFFRKISVTNHSAIRYYYRARNRLDVIKKYIFKLPRQSMLLIRLSLTDTIKVILYEKNKADKTGKMLLGLLHFVFNRYGKY